MQFKLPWLVLLPVIVASQGDIRIGGTNSASGKYHDSGYAEQIRNGWNMWREKVNAQGGLQVGLEKRQIAEFVFVDDESSSEKVADALNDLLDKTPLDFIIGPPASGLNKKAGEVALKRKKIMFSHGADEQIYNSGFKYVFSTLSPAGSYMSSSLVDMKAKGAKTVYIMWKSDNAFATATCAGAQIKAQELGYKILGTHSYVQDKENFGQKAKEIRQFKRTKGQALDILVSCGHKAEAMHVTSYLASLDVNVKALLMSFATGGSYIEGVSNNRAFGVIAPTQWTPTMVSQDDGFFGTSQDFYDDYEKKWGKAPAYQAAYSAANAYSLGKAIELAATTDTEKVRQTLFDMKIDTFYGTIDFSDASHPSGLVGSQPDRKMAALQIQKKPGAGIELGFFDYAPSHTTEQIYPLPTWFERQLQLHPCPEGQEEDLESCKECPTGKYRDSTQLVCSPCGPGEFADVKNLATCKKCPSGTHSSLSWGSTSCTDCAPGRANSQEGQAACIPCPMGQFSSSSKSLECSFCPLGDFSDQVESSSCKTCASEVVEATTTQNIASTSASQCKCPEGMYMSSENKCTACPAGMTCVFGSTTKFEPGSIFPVVQDGYMTKITDRFLVFKCLNEKHCLVGSCMESGCVEGKCATHRNPDSPACGKCEDGAYADGDVCRKCGSSDSLPLVLVLFAAFAALLVLTIIINRDMLRQTNWIVGVSVALTCIVMAVQTTTVYLSVSLEWVEPSKSLLRSLSLVAFDLSTVKADCVMSPDPVIRHLTRQLIPLILAIYVSGVLAVKKMFIKDMPFVGEVSNTIGTLFMIFFVSICVSVFDPFVCYSHPAKTYSSMRSSPSILCFEDPEHTAMMVISVVSFVLVPLPFISVCMRSTVFFTEYMGSRSVEFLRSFRFLFFRFRPNRYFFGVMLLLRSLAITLVPTIIRNDAAAQIMLLTAILLGFLVAHSFNQPWKNSLANRLDAIMSGCILMLLVTGAVGGGFKASETTVQVLSWMVVIIFVGVWVVLLSYSTWKQFTPTDRYEFSLCCDAKQTPAQGRYLKMVLQKQDKKVFLDIDSTLEVDLIFDTVKLKTEHFVLYLSAGSLKNTVVIGQMVTVHKTWLTPDPTIIMCKKVGPVQLAPGNGVNKPIFGKVRNAITIVCTPTFSAPTPSELTNFESYMQAGALRTLVDFGLDKDDVSSAVAALLGKSNSIINCVNLSDSKNATTFFDELSATIVGKSLPKSDDKIRDPANCLVLLANTQDVEACSAGHVLGNILVQNIPNNPQIKLVSCPEDLDALGRANLPKLRAAIVLLSPGSLMNPLQLQAMGDLECDGPHSLVLVCLSGFSPPSLDKYVSNTLPTITTAVSGPAIHALLKNADCEFTPAASNLVCDIQAKNILSKFVDKRSRTPPDPMKESIDVC